MAITATALILTIILLILYVVFLQRQLRSINRQLDKRLTEQTRQPVHLQFINKELTALAININKCLKAEENLRLKGIQEEKNFKELIANVSHDLRTPLTAIKGYQQLLHNDQLTGDQRQKLQIARKHADELGRLIEHFFEYSYLLNAEPELQLGRTNVTNLVSECLAAAVPTLEENNLSIRMAEAPPVFALVDKESVSRMVHNLIRNCIQHSDGDIEVRLHAESKDKAVISIKNRVKGGSAIDTERLFDRFYTGDHARKGSSGLGLSIVKLLAEQLGGSASASMQDGLLEISIALPSVN